MIDETNGIVEKIENKSDSIEELFNLRMEIILLRNEVKILNSETRTEIMFWIAGVGMLEMALITGLALKFAH